MFRWTGWTVAALHIIREAHYRPDGTVMASGLSRLRMRGGLSLLRMTANESGKTRMRNVHLVTDNLTRTACRRERRHDPLRVARASMMS
jgi:hypothetical protein